ncbi:hypothetical protein OJF2_05660 [Aquisphaera giovannonii]|uniref:Tc1-like transposase DDE domain-containing protein n=1 Tax=Aquisphaera giovannonii TaxID=406548 RepID=A0A5B9VVX7_9BACT|nr:hypothetical protein [Aquisphaera giovannonii]QEH32097.1 hypothetical protein OJF2_05660 [Aquisphaera giovannonii]
MSKRCQVSTAIGLTMLGPIYKKHFDHAIHGEGMVEHLEHLRRRTAGPMIIVRGGLHVHRSSPVKAFLAEHPEIGMERHSSYAPELNPQAH